MAVGIKVQIKKAERLAKGGKFAEAIQSYQDILARFPKNESVKAKLSDVQTIFYENSPQHAQRVQALLNSANKKSAETVLSEVNALINALPFLSLLHNVSGVFLARTGQFEKAIAAYQKALSLDPLFKDCEDNLANAYSNFSTRLVSEGKFEEALGALEKAVAGKDSFFEAYNNMANVHYILGDKEKAESAIRKSLSINPAFVEGLKNYSRICRISADDPLFATMKELQENTDLSDLQASQLQFALAKAYEDQGEVDPAMQHFSEGNAIRKKRVEYHLSKDEDLFQKIASLTDGKAVPSIKRENQDNRPIFVVGMPRSGTTLVEQVLASHSDIYGAGELIFLNQNLTPCTTEGGEKIPEVFKGYLDYIAAFPTEKAFIVDKMPLNFRWTGLIMSHLEDALVIDVRRDPIATCWSNFKHDFTSSGNDFSHSLEDVAQYYKMYVDLMDQFAQAFPGRIHRLDYENLTENTSAEIDALFAYLGIEVEPQCYESHKTKRSAHTASSGQVTQPIYKGSSQAWKKYAKHLASLIAAFE
ncbi:sulfotransferase [Terasakiella sp. A23]|uniref:tetratricopeptide repeat-containing sulfotransferase family protein n=1 Tax=Terasakiella sp. FCG-A23 TaxID=3080561 RepID=UPI002953936E|nr:sulfotransferase [Terasakiella sp. A23]MDV7338010.1 sulfotransferase [Terasakiella sp. A23]